MSATVATPAPEAVFDGRAETTAHRITPNEIAGLSALLIFVMLSSIDAVSQIPPLGDDYWMVQKGPGSIALDYWRDYGWGRPLGIAIIDLANTARSAAGASVLTVVLVGRFLTLLAVYLILRRLFAFTSGIALFALLLIAWNPAAGEAWVLLCNLHLAVSVIGVYLTCGLYARALGCLPERAGANSGPESRPFEQRRALIFAVVTQVAVNLTYEQSLLAVPAFVATLTAVGRCAPSSRSSRVTALGAALGAAGICGVFMLMSGYVQSRSPGPPGASAEVSDLGNALKAFWIGFGEHHFWRVIEAVRLRQVFWWDVSVMGIMAAIGTLGASAAVAWRLARESTARSTSPNFGIAVAAVVAAYAAFLPSGLAYPGYTIVSRLFYLPGAFLALSIASLVPAGRRDSSGRIAILVGTVLLWLGILSRRYYEDMQGGSRILRSVARAIAQVPPSLRSGGVLVIAPSNVGTFSTSAVEPWSIRAATRELTGLDPEGPIFLVSDCAELERGRATRVDDAYRQVPRQMWSAVVRYQSGGVEIHSNAQSACAPTATVGSRAGTPNPS